MEIFKFATDFLRGAEGKEPDEKLSKDKISELEEVKKFVIEQYESHPLKGMEHMKRAYQKAFVDGHHYMDIGESPEKTIKKTKKKAAKYRSRVNNVRRNQSISVAKIMKDEPIIRAVPSGSSIEDIETARISNGVFDNLYAQNEIDLTGKTYINLKTSNTNGTAWYKVIWNPLLKDGMGDIQISIHDDFEILPDPSATSWWDMEWYLHAYLQDIYKLERIFPKLKGKIREWSNNQENRARNLYTQEYYYDHENSYKGKAFVLEFVSRAGGMYPKGKKIVLLNLEIVAKYGDNPFHSFGHYFSMNAIPLVWDPVYGKLHGRSGVDDQIPLNKEINKIGSLTMENIWRTAAFKIALPLGSAKADELLADRVSAFYYNASQGGKPSVLETPSMPPYISQYLSYLTGTMQDLAGVHEVSMGQLPERGSQMSGSALKLLQDSEMVSHSPVMRSLKSTLCVLGQLVLMIVQKYYVEERLVTITGEGRRNAIKKFLGADMRGSVSVKLQTASVFNTSASAKAEGVMALYEKGIMQDAENGSRAAKKALQALEFGQVDEIYQLESAHERKAQWIIEEIANNRKVPDIQPFDDHKIHLRALEEFMLNRDFEEQEDEMKEIFIQRWQRHKELLMQNPEQQGQAGAQAQASGSGQAMPSAAVNANMMLAEGPPTAGGAMPLPPEGGMQ